MFQREMRRDCHILGRTQVEGLMHEHLDLVAEILYLGLTESECDEVMAYFKDGTTEIPPPSVLVGPPPGALAGLPFHIPVDVRWTLASNPDARLWWRPRATAPDPGVLMLIGPNGADGAGGMRLGYAGAADDPFSASCVLEFVTYTVGRVDLGEIVVGLGDADRGPTRPGRARRGSTCARTCALASSIGPTDRR